MQDSSYFVHRVDHPQLDTLIFVFLHIDNQVFYLHFQFADEIVLVDVLVVEFEEDGPDFEGFVERDVEALVPYWVLAAFLLG